MSAQAAQAVQVGKAFVEFYYSTFDRNRAELRALYRATSSLTFEGQSYWGANDIAEKLEGLPFQQVRHNMSTFDAVPIQPEAGIFLTVTGQLLIDDESNPQFFTQSFTLFNDGAGYFVQNDIFRLIYA